MKFREMVSELTGVDPILEATTIASTTNLVFRTKFMEPNTIALIPPGGYQQGDNQSIVALKWMRWISEKENIRIQHARNGGEVTIKVNDKSYKVDGYSEANGKKVCIFFYLFLLFISKAKLPYCFRLYLSSMGVVIMDAASVTLIAPSKSSTQTRQWMIGSRQLYQRD